MIKEKIYIFDTTLRDGAQTEGVNFSIDDKNKIAKSLSDLGVDYLECWWNGDNTLDTTFFNNPPNLGNTILTAFGMTKKAGRSAENDPVLRRKFCIAENKYKNAVTIDLRGVLQRRSK